MITRKQYMNKECTHREYYSQFVTDNIRKSVETYLGPDLIIKSLREDEHLNNIPLGKWDRMNCCISRSAFKEAGGTYSLAGCVCVLKEAARQVAEMDQV